MNLKKTFAHEFTLFRQIPNLLTIMRMFLVIPISLLLLSFNFIWAMVLLLIAAVSDALDGYIAKKLGLVSTFGSIMDPIADKLLLVSSFATLTYLGLIPFWLCILVVVRDLAIVAAVTGYFLVSDNVNVKPSLMSKLNTLFQIILVLYVVFSTQFDFESPLELVLIGFVASTTIISGLDYAIRWLRGAYDNVKGSKID